MGFYAVSTTKLSNPDSSANVKKIFYADDGSAGGKLDSLHEWWSDLKQTGPLYGYYPEPTKSWLVVKPGHEDRAREIFPDIKITTDGRKFLGSFIGSAVATNTFVGDKIAEWEKDVKALAKIAETEPQLAYSAYIYGTCRRWQFVCRTTPGIAEAFYPLEQMIRNTLIPAFMGGREVSEELRMILSLPARMGGMGILDPCGEADWEYENSLLVTDQLTDAIFCQKPSLEVDEKVQDSVMKDLRRRKEERWKERQERICSVLSEKLCRIVQLGSEKGSSTWLTSLPLKSYGFRLNKQQFLDALCMRYDLKLTDVPRNCTCGDEYSINHCLTCKRGGYVIIRHNAVRDTLAEVLQEVCKDVKVEPPLLPVTGEVLPASANKTDGARSDVSAVGLWHPMNRAFIDVMVFNPHAQSNAAMNLSQMYISHERSKKREYNDRILQVEKGSFSPAVFSCSGGASPETTKLLKVIAAKLAVKRGEQYNTSINFLRRRISFDILRTCLMSFRGERGASQHQSIKDLDIGQQVMELY